MATDTVMGDSGNSTIWPSGINNDTDAEDYVNSVMSSQPIPATANTPLPSGRKRSLSVSDMTSMSETEMKKYKNDKESQDRRVRPVAQVRRNLLRSKDIERNTEGERSPETSPEDRETTTATTAESSSANTNNSDKTRGAAADGKNKGKGGKKTGKATEKVTQKGGGATGATVTPASADQSCDIKLLLRKLSDDMQSMHGSLNRKIDLIEDKIEQSERRITEKVTDKVIKLLDKRVSQESAQLRREIDDRISELRGDFDSELNDLGARLDRVSQNVVPENGEDIRLRVVVRNLPETVNENVKDKVDSMIRDGLKIRDVQVDSAERKQPRHESDSGLAVAKFKDAGDKAKVMKAKRNLKDSRQYERVYNNHDQTRE